MCALTCSLRLTEQRLIAVLSLTVRTVPTFQASVISSNNSEFEFVPKTTPSVHITVLGGAGRLLLGVKSTRIGRTCLTFI